MYIYYVCKSYCGRGWLFFCRLRLWYAYTATAKMTVSVVMLFLSSALFAAVCATEVQVSTVPICTPPCKTGEVICTWDSGGNGFNGSTSCQRACGAPVGSGSACKMSANIAIPAGGDGPRRLDGLASPVLPLVPQTKTYLIAPTWLVPSGRGIMVVAKDNLAMVAIPAAQRSVTV